MESQADQKQFGQCAHSGYFPVDLSVAQPFRKKQGYPAQQNQQKIGRRHSGKVIQEIQGEKDSRTDLVSGANEYRQHKYPKRPWTNSAQPFLCLHFGVTFICHSRELSSFLVCMDMEYV